MVTRVSCTVAAAMLVTLAVGCAKKADLPNWTTYGGSPAGDHYSVLDQIDTANAAQLQQVWRFDTGPGGLQTSPVIVGEIMYVVTPAQTIIALDAATGIQRWQRVLPDANQQPVRGLTYWQDGVERRLLVGTGAYLTALDPMTGAPVATFGTQGRVDLREGLGRPATSLPVAMTTPGTIYRDVIIVGFRTTESKPSAPGAVRAYSARTGALQWSFSFIPKPGERGSETWPASALADAGGANSWPGVAVDTARGIVYVPTGSAVEDFYGGDREGSNLFANSLVALEAATGRYRWHQQLVHHDIWDRDLPSPPVLLTVQRDGQAVDAVAQATKHGFLFLFHRETGGPLFDIEERAVPVSDVPGEHAWPTQPHPVLPKPFARQTLTPDSVTNRSPAARAAALKALRHMQVDGPFMPLSLTKQTVIFPGFDGGAEWGGQAVDPARGVVFINANDVPWTGGLATRSTTGGAGSGKDFYVRNCVACHGVDLKGSPPAFPSLEGILNRRVEGDVAGVIMGGKGRMPGFAAQIDAAKIQALLAYLRSPAAGTAGREMVAAKGGKDTPGEYVFTGYKKFVDAEGYPAVTPPWGTLSAIDMNTGNYLWRVPLGQYPKLAASGETDTGSENYGGPILTKGGLLFIGATIYDRKFRAFDAATGRVLWEATLPFAGVATPTTYMVGGRQFVVIATSASRDRSAEPGSSYVAFALRK